jgi:hypothetical protein
MVWCGDIIASRVRSISLIEAYEKAPVLKWKWTNSDRITKICEAPQRNWSDQRVQSGIKFRDRIDFSANATPVTSDVPLTDALVIAPAAQDVRRWWIACGKVPA